MECPVCKKEFDEKTGRRPKKFCSDACKVKFWNREKVAKIKYKHFLMPNSSITDIDTEKVIKNETKEIIEVTKEIEENSKEKIKEQIEILRKEIIHVPDNYSETGRIIWVKEREKKIKELKQQLL